MRQLSLMLAGACVCVAAGRALHAQANPDTTTASFREGEWGIGFIVRNSVTEAGVLRFSTPARAWVLDGTASFDRQSLSSSSVVGDQTQRSWYVNGQFGPRWYHAMSGHVTRFLGFGALAAYGHADYSGTSGHSSISSLGAYGETGMQYMLTRYLAFGWRGTVSASRGETSSTDLTSQGFVATSNATAYHVGLDAVQLTGTIYF